MSPSQETLLAGLYNKAQAFDGMGQYSSAAQCYQKIIDIDPSFNGGSMYYEQGQLYQLAKLHSDSRRAY
jgi:tetratricopeptide (TPR) repeat protein